MNQLQDPEIIRELYGASGDGVPIVLNVRGLCCLRPGVPGLSETIRVFGVVGRFLEHSRIYAFTNGGDPEYYIGSADWMKRNLDRRVETIIPLLDDRVKEQMAVLLRSYEQDNSSAWDCDTEGVYHRRVPAKGESRREAQETFMRRAAGEETGLPSPGPGEDPGGSGPRAVAS
jgi:polyphosphate kinase